MLQSVVLMYSANYVLEITYQYWSLKRSLTHMVYVQRPGYFLQSSFYSENPGSWESGNQVKARHTITFHHPIGQKV